MPIHEHNDHLFDHTAVTDHVDAPSAASLLLAIASLALGGMALCACWSTSTQPTVMWLVLSGVITALVAVVCDRLRHRIVLQVAATSFVLCAFSISTSIIVAKLKSDCPDDEPSATSSTKTPKPFSPFANVRWNEPVSNGLIQLRVVAARRGCVKFAYPEMPLNYEARHANRLILEVEIKNISCWRPIRYTSWQASFKRPTAGQWEPAQLTDGSGIPLIGTGYPPQLPEGRSTQMPLEPGHALRDVLVFEDVRDRTRDLKLELDGTHVEGSGFARFEIPQSVIQWDEK